jgi:short-subunit dehydrogenase
MKVALITGTTSGIGEATALQLAHEGYALVLAGRRADRLNSLSERLSAIDVRHVTVPTDVRDDAQLANLARVALSQFGQVDVIVNNAGVGESHKAWQVGDNTLQLIMETNFYAPVKLVSLLVPGMVERKSGHVINIGSVASHVSGPNTSLYCASKFALRAWNDALRRELHGTGVKVSLVSPGYIRTEMTADVKFAMPGPEVVAKTISSLIRNPKREKIVPWYYRPLIWISRFSGRFTDYVLIRSLG